MVRARSMLRFFSPQVAWLVSRMALSLRTNPPSLRRLQLMEAGSNFSAGTAGLVVYQVALPWHGSPGQQRLCSASPCVQFLRDLVEGAPHRGETLHFVSAREMVNIILAASDGREGNPGEYRDYRLKRLRPAPVQSDSADATKLVLKG